MSVVLVRPYMTEYFADVRGETGFIQKLCFKRDVFYDKVPVEVEKKLQVTKNFIVITEEDDGYEAFRESYKERNMYKVIRLDYRMFFDTVKAKQDSQRIIATEEKIDKVDGVPIENANAYMLDEKITKVIGKVAADDTTDYEMIPPSDKVPEGVIPLTPETKPEYDSHGPITTEVTGKVGPPQKTKLGKRLKLKPRNKV